VRVESSALTAPVAGGARLIAVDGLVKRFGQVIALDGVSVALDAPATGLLGANGAGKSTLMRLLLGLLRPDEGAVEVLGVDASRDTAEVRRRLGYMPELDCLPLEMTARDLVVHMAELRGLPRRDAVLRASEVLFQVGLEEERSRLIRTFSTGMKQRAKLAQALVHSPELVVLDEPTNGLDPSGREEMLALVRRLSSELGIAVLLSSHVLEDVTRTCDAVVVLRDGRVVTSGRIDEMEGLAADGVLVRATGDLDAFAGRLAARGLAARARDGGVAVSGAPEDALLDGVRDAAAEAGIALRELRPAGPTLEDALVDALE
jgi:ABC-2 type transport system ATP-binding protein